MSISSEITRLQNAKADLKTAIEGKGVTVSSSAKLEDYADLVDSIPTSGSDKDSLYFDLKPVAFVDYDGTLLHNYDVEEFLAMNTLPNNPTHEGLVAEGWNWTLQSAKEFVQEYGCVCIGQNYKTNDDYTRIYMTVPSELVGCEVVLNVNMETSGSITIDWGDGTNLTITGSGNKQGTHIYSTVGEYIIKIKLNSGTYRLGYWGSNRTVFSYDSAERRKAFMCVTKVEMSGDCNGFCRMCFADMNIKSISISRANVKIGESTGNVFRNTRVTGLVFPPNAELVGVNQAYGTPARFVSFPYTAVDNTDISTNSAVMLSVNATGTTAKALCGGLYLRYVGIGGDFTEVGQYAVQNSYRLRQIIIPSTVQKIVDYALNNNMLAELHLRPTTPPTLANSRGVTGFAKYYVPYSADHSILNAYQTATNWSTYATKMEEEPQ